MNYKVKIASRIFDVQIADLNARPILAIVDGEEVEVWPEETGAPAAARPAAAPAPRPASRPAAPTPSPAPEKPAPATDGANLGKAVRAPIPGVIISVAVQPGDEVSPGQELCVLEAMKMKNVIRSNRSGKIAAVKVSNGQHVAHHDVLMEYAD